MSFNVDVECKSDFERMADMAWQTVPGLAGKIFVPEPASGGKKHRCPDCFACQRCSDERCGVCADQGRPHTQRSQSSCTSPKEVEI
jgi:hypothetical protein